VDDDDVVDELEDEIVDELTSEFELEDKELDAEVLRDLGFEPPGTSRELEPCFLHFTWNFSVSVLLSDPRFESAGIS
jgi:hypothetical protein